MAPNRTQLQNISKREHESFKEYAQRWRNLEAQVAPPVVERDDHYDSGHVTSVLLQKVGGIHAQ